MAITTSYRTRSDAVPLRSFKAKGRPSAIAGVGVYAPEKIISNFDLEKMMDTSDKWITERTGIHRRHIAEPGTTTFDLATRAARAALKAANVEAKDLDMILVGTSSPDGPFPSVACRVQNELDPPGDRGLPGGRCGTRRDRPVGAAPGQLPHHRRGRAPHRPADGACRGQHRRVRQHVERLHPAGSRRGRAEGPGQVRRPRSARGV